ncbi:MAG: single-stranded DNA-binding protein [Deferribacterales bacterium]|jgi:single-strand DNA-binding protein|uniref:single-stranded DNA-binding protein n=1 Tax=Deferrivibrio essentukiensis TaxID=2880922 RepID=UPI0019AD70D5|nr:single-stranded DNA-binding protein [Deferrivibrio essentukiensis]MBC7196915.1 single-stranded DNA-binding protein [Deferribacterales bacterium]MBZ4672963.1 ssb [Deferribacteraceae bacterium]MCB4203710.1 single-stranded DNA-binding protein [Deferrivibrio essentukiensis]
MGFLNKVILLGNVTKNPEVRYIPGSGTPAARFGLAVNRRYKSGDSVKDEACFIDIVAFSRLAEFAGEYIVKGMPILVEGRLSFRTWEQDGVKRSKHEIVAENIQLVQRKESSAVNDEIDTVSEDIVDDDIPF